MIYGGSLDAVIGGGIGNQRGEIHLARTVEVTKTGDNDRKRIEVRCIAPCNHISAGLRYIIRINRDQGVVLPVGQLFLFIVAVSLVGGSNNGCLDLFAAVPDRLHQGVGAPDICFPGQERVGLCDTHFHLGRQMKAAGNPLLHDHFSQKLLVGDVTEDDMNAVCEPFVE